MNNPLVSIIIPCYNQAQYLDDALLCVFQQTYENWECIIVNDGSSDNTEEVVKNWLVNDSRFKYFFQENQGLSSARNLGLEKMNGEFIQFLDSDDIIDSNKINESLNEVHKGNFDLIISDFRIFHKNHLHSDSPFWILKQEYFDLENILNNWDYKFSIPIHCGFFKKTLLENFKFPIQLKAREDWVMWIYIFNRQPSCFFLKSPMAYYRIHGNSMTFNRDFMNRSLLKALDFIKDSITKEQSNELLLLRLKRALKEGKSFETKYGNIRDSNSYKLGIKIKKLLKQTHLLVICKKVLKIYK